MSNKTTNYGLRKPLQEEYYNIDDFNGNADIIDSELKKQEVEIKKNQEWIGEATSETSKIDTRVKVLESDLYNPNLIINSNFKVSELVNQRGSTSYTSGGYCVDMWRKIQSGTADEVDLTGTYLKLIKTTANTTYFTFSQYMENTVYANKMTITLKIKGTVGKQIEILRKMSNAFVVSSYTLTGNDDTLSLTFDASVGFSGAEIRLSSPQTVTLYYIKAEVGTKSTTFIDDDNATKLVKCQRYLQKIHGLGRVWKVFGQGQARSATSATAFVHLITHMRTFPTMTWGGNMIFVVHGVTSSTVTNIQSGAGSTLEDYYLELTTTGGLRAGDCGFLQANADSTAFVLFSAEM